ncbi:MAG: hypothetical protein HYY41_01220 [Chloroflexi bacterium]|nr:hypothetical protein [Chloroflexota bacterium]
MLFGSPVYAQEEQLPDPGITPDSPFYFLDNFGKSLGLLLAFGPEAKAEKALAYAGERLAEARAMATANKSRGLERAAAGYDKFLSIAAEKVEEARQQGLPEDLSERVALAASKHLSVLDTVADALPEVTPEQARQAITRAKEASINGQKNALRVLARGKPDRAIEINLDTISGRLNRARAAAGESDTEGVEDAINDTEKLFKFGEEISEIARGLGKDTTTVEELVARATTIHLEVLAAVYEKVPEQARPAIERVMASSIRGHDTAVEALKEKGALGEGVTAEAILPEIVPQEVRDRISGLKREVPEPAVSENGTEKRQIPGPAMERGRRP